MQNNVLFNQIIQTSGVRMFSIKIVFDSENIVQSIKATLTPKDVAHIFETGICPVCFVYGQVGSNLKTCSIADVKIQNGSSITITTKDDTITGNVSDNTWEI